MSRINDARVLLALLLITLFTAPLFAEDDDNRFELKFAKDVPLRGGKVTVDHAFGDLDLRTHNNSNVQVRATIRSSDEEVGKQIHITVVQESTGVTIRTLIPEVRNRRGRLSYSVDMTVTVPANAGVMAKNRFGNTDVRGLASTSIENKQGAISLRDGRGTQTLTNSFGAIEVTENRGDVVLVNSNGSVTVRKIEGALDVTNRFGSINVSDVRGNATLTNSNGQIDVIDVGGSLTVTNGFGGIKVSSIGKSATISTTNARVEIVNVNGNATVANSFGSVNASGIKGNLQIDGSNSTVDADDVTGSVRVDTGFGGVNLKNIGKGADVKSSNGNIKVSDLGGSFSADARFGSVRADRVQGSATVESSNGSVTLNDISSGAKVRASFGSVFIANVGTGSVDVANSNGAISVSGVRECRMISLKTNFSPIKLALAEGSYTVSARTTFGHVKSELPITTTNVSQGSLTGTIGRGGCKVDLTNSNGNITIEKE